MWVPGLMIGDAYTFTVQAGTATGYSPATTSNAVTVQSGCAAANVCLSVDGNDPGTATNHVASGFLLGVLPPSTPASLVTPLKAQSWRTALGPPVCTAGQCVGYLFYDSAKAVAPTASFTAVLSDNWYEDTYLAYRECPSLLLCGLENDGTPYGGAATPWSNWPLYDQSISAVVQTVEASGRSVNYWDLVNEPPGTTNKNDAYFDYDDAAVITLADEEQWLLHTYNDVKAVDPSAQVVCPSLTSYEDYPGETAASNELLDFSTFLAFAAANGIDCNAFSWHEIVAAGAATDFNAQPQDIQAHVARFRSLLAQYPQFSGAKIFINEYGGFVPPTGSVNNEDLTGWVVGDIAALEAAGVDQANRSCTPNFGCNNLLDDLFVQSGSSLVPSAVYWPYLYYAQMEGNSVPVTSSEEQISGFATANSSTRTLMMLVGRHDIQGKPGNPAAQSVAMTVAVPSSWVASSVKVSLALFPGIGGAVSQPVPTITTVPVINGQATIVIPSFGSQNAYGVTITPAS
jgi:hypothetical protein